MAGVRAMKLYKSLMCFSRLLLLSYIIIVQFVFIQYALADDIDEIWDPFEPVNRQIFKLNDATYTYILKPVAEGYDTVMPDVAQTGISNFFSNLRYPIYLISDILQLKFEQAAEHTARVALNTTLGIAGFVDVAKDLGIVHHEEDFGIALGFWEVPHGPYIVIPFLGMSTLRDAVGLSVDKLLLDPLSYDLYFNTLSSQEDLILTASTVTLETTNTLSDKIRVIEAAKSASVDYYLFSQGAYYQHRENLVTDGSSDDEFEEE